MALTFNEEIITSRFLEKLQSPDCTRATRVETLIKFASDEALDAFLQLQEQEPPAPQRPRVRRHVHSIRVVALEIRVEDLAALSESATHLRIEQIDEDFR